jgi:predicted pyridoxine 5'-phosphate oxidase superfamily flavin-nucleotide-binding protein
MSAFHRIAFGPSVRAVQSEYGSRDGYARVERAHAGPVELGRDEREFIESIDGFYLGSTTDDGWPYIQYRGGPAGFLKVLGPTTLGFADFGGNRQFISVGNVRHDDRVSLFLMDYAARTRLKLFARMRVVPASDDPALAERLVMPEYPGRVERLVTLEVAGFDWNCPKHIVERFTREQIAPVLERYQARIAELEGRLRDAETKA